MTVANSRGAKGAPPPHGVQATNAIQQNTHKDGAQPPSPTQTHVVYMVAPPTLEPVDHSQNWATGATVAMAIFTAALIVTSIWQNIIAGRTAKAAKLNAEAIIRMETPRFVLEGIGVSEIKDGKTKILPPTVKANSPQNEQIKITVGFGNHGKTPAYIEEHALAFDIVDNLDEAYAKPYTSDRVIDSPKAERSTKPNHYYYPELMIPSSAFLSIVDQNKIMRVYGDVRYRDFREVTWVRNFCAGFKLERTYTLSGDPDQYHLFTAIHGIGGEHRNNTQQINI